jgi:circadian clock protein KaiC
MEVDTVKKIKGSPIKRKILALAKSPTGIKGIDEITSGGLPKGRTTLVCGNAGCGKTIFALEVLINGALKYDEPGLFISFEETPEKCSLHGRGLKTIN